MEREIIWQPQSGPQAAMLRCPCRDVFYGGAAGGGKSDGLLGDFIQGVERYGSSWHGLIARQTFAMLEEIESRALALFSPHYGVNAYKRGKRTWQLPTANGVATLKLRAIEDITDALKHQGHSYTWIGFDELTQWATDDAFEYLITRLRPRDGDPMGGIVPLYIRATANPGGVGHNWVKDRYRIGIQPPMEPWVYARDPKTGQELERVFIPASLYDNKILMQNDPTYEMNLANIADPILRRALYRGDWNIASGAAFPEFTPETHVVPYHKPPAGAVIYRSCDWGYEKPFAVIWSYADFDGNLVAFNEMYGMGPKPGVGSRTDPEIVWEKIQEYEKTHGIRPMMKLLDPQCWAEHGGQSIFELLGGYKAGWEPWPKGKNSRENHKQIVHNYLRTVNGRPKLVLCDNCIHGIRTLPVVQTDRRNVMVVDTNGEDHWYDALRGMLAAINPNTHAARKRRYEKNMFEDFEPQLKTGPSRGYGGH